MAFLETVGLSKRYPGVQALEGVDFAAELGEVHALVGANGAGKSTFMGLLAGAVRPSEGTIRLDGTPVQLSSPAVARAHGITIVYQAFSLVPHLSVARNVFLGREPRGRLGLIDESRLTAQARELFE